MYADLIIAIRRPLSCIINAHQAHKSLKGIIIQEIESDEQCGICRAGDVGWSYWCPQYNLLICDRCHCLRIKLCAREEHTCAVLDIVADVHDNIQTIRADAKNTFERVIMCNILVRGPHTYYGSCALCLSRLSNMYQVGNERVYICARCDAAARDNATIRMRRLCICGQVIAAFPLYDVCGVIYDVFLRIC